RSNSVLKNLAIPALALAPFALSIACGSDAAAPNKSQLASDLGTFVDANHDGIVDSIDTNGDGMPALRTGTATVTVPASCHYVNPVSNGQSGGSGGSPGAGGSNNAGGTPSTGGSGPRGGSPGTGGTPGS